MKGFRRAFDQYLDCVPNGVVQATDQPGRLVAGGQVLSVELPVTVPSGNDFFRLESSTFRITKLTYYLDIDDEYAFDDPSQRDLHFQICLWIDNKAQGSVISNNNVPPAFYQFLACADRAGRYIYDSIMPPMPNMRFQDRFVMLAVHEIEVPPQWNYNGSLPTLGGVVPNPAEWDYTSSRWQGQLPWDETLYQPRPGFPGPWTGEGPDPRTPYIQGDGADMNREFRWGQETIQFGQPALPCDSVLQTETSSTTPTDQDTKYWSGSSFGDNPGLYGVQFDVYPPLAPVHGVVPQRPIVQWNNQIGGYATLGHLGAKADNIAQQTHRVVKAREGARCLRTNNATYLNDVAIRIDDKQTNFIRRTLDLSEFDFQLFTTYENPSVITHYNKCLYWTVWAEGTTYPTQIIPTVHLKMRIEFEAI